MLAQLKGCSGKWGDLHHLSPVASRGMRVPKETKRFRWCKSYVPCVTIVLSERGLGKVQALSEREQHVMNVLPSSHHLQVWGNVSTAWVCSRHFVRWCVSMRSEEPLPM